MRFNSLLFVFAFPCFTVLYFLIPGRLQQPLLLLASVAACATAGWESLAWFLIITALAYVAGRGIARSRSRASVVAAVVALLAPLVVLKYTNFFLSSIRDVAATIGWRVDTPHVSAGIPLGLSFYTFVVIGYVVDVYLERIEPEQRLDRFALFTSFFPKFVAGPVERGASFLPQMESPKTFDYDRVTDGIRIIGWGFFKKVVVADRLAVVVDSVYAAPENFRGLLLVMTSAFYMFQVYYDFSGYSDIAVGSAKILGYDLTWNFNRPYAARSVSDYWRRWHISLTTWFFDYIFWPLTAALRSWKSGAILVGLFFTFLVSGLWHGAQWTFVVFGLLHCAALSIEYLTARRRRAARRRIPKRLFEVLAWCWTFTFLLFADIIFRASAMKQAFAIMARMVGGIGPDMAFLAHAHFRSSAFKALIAGLPGFKIELVIAVVAIAVVEIAGLLGTRRPWRDRLLARPPVLRWAVYYSVVSAIVYLGAYNTTTAFLYMQF